MCGADLESWFAPRALWWAGGTGLYQNKLLTGDGGYGLCRAADFSKWGVVIHGWLVYSESAGETRVKALPFPLLSTQLCRKTACVHNKCIALDYTGVFSSVNILATIVKTKKTICFGDICITDEMMSKKLYLWVLNYRVTRLSKWLRVFSINKVGVSV